MIGTLTVKETPFVSVRILEVKKMNINKRESKEKWCSTPKEVKEFRCQGSPVHVSIEMEVRLAIFESDGTDEVSVFYEELDVCPLL